AAILVCVSAFAFEHTPLFGHFTNAGGTASGLDHTIGSTAAAFFAIVLLNASLIGAGAVTLATSYVLGDVFGSRGSLHRKFSEEKGFYTMFGALIVVAAGIVLIPGAPLGVITEAVQALCGILLPMTTLFLLMLCNDREVLGPWANPPWLKALASVGGAVLAVVLASAGVVAIRARRGAGAVTVLGQTPDVPREQWTMPPATLLSRPRWSPARHGAMLALGAYMVVALVMLLVK